VDGAREEGDCERGWKEVSVHPSMLALTQQRDFDSMALSLYIYTVHLQHQTSKKTHCTMIVAS